MISLPFKRALDKSIMRCALTKVLSVQRDSTSFSSKILHKSTFSFHNRICLLTFNKFSFASVPDVLYIPYLCYALNSFLLLALYSNVLVCFFFMRSSLYLLRSFVLFLQREKIGVARSEFKVTFARVQIPYSKVSLSIDK